jgi:hypothetical protein
MALSMNCMIPLRISIKFYVVVFLTKGMVLGTPDHMSQCIAFTGEVAEETAKIIARELNWKLKS